MENLIKKIDQMKNLAVCQGCRSIHFTLKYALITKGQLMNIPKDKTLSGKSPINLAFASNNHQLQHILKSVLDTDDYHLQSSKNASKCLEIAHQCQVVIVDLMLNDMDGLSLIEELREQYRGLHIIAVMNKESLELVNLTADNITLMAAQSGANAVFIAPFNLAELVATVERFINDIASIH